MNSLESLQKNLFEAEDTEAQSKTMEPPVEEESIWEREARRLFPPRDPDRHWKPWTEEEILQQEKNFADAIAKYGAEVFDGDEERIDVVVGDPTDDNAITDDDEDFVIEDPVDTISKGFTVDDYAAWFQRPKVNPVEDPVEDPKDDTLEEEDPEEEPADAACPPAVLDASAVSSSDPHPDNH